MKRTELKRKTPLKAKSGLKQGSALKRTHMKRKAKSKKQPIQGGQWQSQKMLDYVRTLPCCMTQQPADCTHHIIGVGLFGGMGTKAPDWAVMPVTNEAHRRIHESPKEHRDLQWMALGMTLGIPIEDGFLIINPEYKL